ncbi:MAG: fasciclin domain-containing protein [Pyrinomonadaceae bacterium]|nr:fasciclin domain-containing protein [Pyrinomonadaceae bacterium]
MRKMTKVLLSAFALMFIMVVGASAQTSYCTVSAAKAKKVSYKRASHPQASDIVDTAVAAGNFTTLATALEAADLITTLKGAGPFTVFAPTDAAFAKLPKATLESLLKPENKATLVKILTYHVVPGKVLAADVVKIKSAKTVQGQSVKINAKGGKVVLNGNSNVTQTDIQTSNGVIHVIDTVLMPK